ncbi:cation:proton antiporter [Salipiger manganoxidans]|uniref:cation:proton antiporter n=1 Tax=Salipiger marinus TaxID=555512 RepID=UPI001E2B7AD0|nr:sodium:proton antiporter [Salipiger manganoxidans]MCD1620675.1 cation:proton antiporter [Salipiger manganoxidans]
MTDAGVAGIDPVLGFALVGALGVGSQWLAWRLKLPGIVVMLLAGLAAGPGLGLLLPSEQFGALMQPMLAIAVAIILFEGGMTLNIQSLRDATVGVRRLVLIGTPLGWAVSALTLRWVAGLSWESSAVFGGILIVTGPTVIAPLLRQARLRKRPAALLQWEAIVNDPIGALAAVLAFELVSVLADASSVGGALADLAMGLVVATLLGVAGGWGLVQAFRRGQVPEYMKVPVLFVSVLAVFALADSVLHESGLLTVTIMGLWIANSGLASYTEMHRFKEQATILLVSGVFILLAANMTVDTLATLDWRALAFVVAVILVARPLPVLVSMLGSNVPWRERVLVAFTGPRGVVLVAVAGLFGERLAALGIEDGSRIGTLAFALVAATVVLHGFTLTPMARALGLIASDTPGVLIVGGSRWATALGLALKKLEVPVLVADPNHAHLRHARDAGLETFFGDILSEAAEHRLDLVSYDKLLTATDNDAYNTLVATDLAPAFGREHVFQLKRGREASSRHALPATLGGQRFGPDETFFEANARLAEGWEFRVTRLSEEFTLEDWRAHNPGAVPMADLGPNGTFRLLGPEQPPKETAGTRLVALIPAREDRQEAARAAEADKTGESTDSI